VDLAVRQGTVHAVLGPNGAGKTTAVRILATLLRPDKGSAYVNGYDVLRQPGKVRETVGLTGQRDPAAPGQQPEAVTEPPGACGAAKLPASASAVPRHSRIASSVAGRQFLAPHRFGQRACAHRPAACQREPRDQVPQPGAGDDDGFAPVVTDLKWA
jgi:ABC transporter